MIELLTDHLKKCPASGKKVSRMYHVFNSILEDLVQYPEPYSFQRKIEKDIEEGNVIIFNWGRHKIPIDEKKKMINTNPAENIKKAIEQADWYARKGNYIQNPTGFFINALSKQRI